MAMFDGWVTGHHWRTDYTCGAWLIWVGTTIHGVAIVDTRAIADGWRTDGRKIFCPYKCGAWLHWAGATIWGMSMFDGWVTGHHWHT